MKKVAREMKFDPRFCTQGKVEKGVEKLPSGKLCGFVGYSSVGGISDY